MTNASGERSSHPRAAAVLQDAHAALLESWLECIPTLASADAPTTADVAAALGSVLEGLYAALRTPDQNDLDALGFIRGYIRRSVLRRVTGSSLLRWCHQLERIVWDHLAALAGSDAEIAGDLLSTMRRVMEFITALDAVCAQAFEETEAAIAHSQDVVRRRLVERLISGAPPGPGALTQAAAECGLVRGQSVIVTVLRPLMSFSDDGQAAVAAFAVSTAGRGPAAPAAIVHGDVVTVSPLSEEAAGTHVDSVTRMHLRLSERGIASEIGISAIHDDLTDSQDAYAEALLALTLAGPGRPVVALTGQSALDYLILRGGDRTAWRLIRQDLRDLLTDPSEESQALVATLSALIRSDGNVRVAAHRLNVHANTVHARVSKVRSLTGLDPRSFADLREFYLALRLAPQTVGPRTS